MGKAAHELRRLENVLTVVVIATRKRDQTVLEGVSLCCVVFTGEGNVTAAIDAIAVVRARFCLFRSTVARER